MPELRVSGLSTRESGSRQNPTSPSPVDAILLDLMCGTNPEVAMEAQTRLLSPSQIGYATTNGIAEPPVDYEYIMDNAPEQLYRTSLPMRPRKRWGLPILLQ